MEELDFVDVLAQNRCFDLVDFMFPAIAAVHIHHRFEAKQVESLGMQLVPEGLAL